MRVKKAMLRDFLSTLTLTDDDMRECLYGNKPSNKMTNGTTKAAAKAAATGTREVGQSRVALPASAPMKIKIPQTTVPSVSTVSSSSNSSAHSDDDDCCSITDMPIDCDSDDGISGVRSPGPANARVIGRKRAFAHLRLRAVSNDDEESMGVGVVSPRPEYMLPSATWSGAVEKYSEDAVALPTLDEATYMYVQERRERNARAKCASEASVSH